MSSPPHGITRAAGRPLRAWVLQTGEPLHVDAGEQRPMRAMNVANALLGAGHRVTVWSAAFSHQERRHRARVAQRITVAERLEYRLVPSPGYRRNIGPGRLWDHARLAMNLGRLLRAEPEPPDICFIGYPPIETAAVMIRWLRARGAPTLLDIKDQWPSLFVEAAPAALRAPARLALSPYYALARRAMRDATGISAMSESFLRWALEFAGRPRSDTDLIAPLTSPDAPIDERALADATRWWESRGIPARPDGVPRLMFVGSHTRSFDFTTVVTAARSLASRGVAAEFVICGTGERSAEWQAMAADVPSLRFPGWVDRAKIRVLADASVAFIAPYRSSPGFDLNMPNKIVDALGLGMPIVTPLEGEVGALIDRHGIGLRYLRGDPDSLAAAVESLLADAPERERISASARRLYEEQFTFERVYGGLVAHLERMAAAGIGTGGKGA